MFRSFAYVDGRENLSPDERNQDRQQTAEDGNLLQPGYKNSVSYGRWHASLPVTRDLEDLNGSHQQKSRQEKSSSCIDPESFGSHEFGFEPLKRTYGNFGQKRKMTSNTKSCLDHISDLHRFSAEYGADLDSWRSFLNKDRRTYAPNVDLSRSEIPELIMLEEANKRQKTVDIANPPTFHPSKTDSQRKPKVQFAVPVVPAPSQSKHNLRRFGSPVENDSIASSSLMQPKSSYFDNSQTDSVKNSVENVFIETETPKLENLLENSKSAKQLRKLQTESRSRRVLPQLSRTTSTSSQIVWSQPPSQPLKGGNTAKLTIVENLAALIESSDFVFSPKYAQALSRLPEIRHMVVPANSLQFQSGGLSIRSALVQSAVPQ